MNPSRRRVLGLPSPLGVELQPPAEATDPPIDQPIDRPPEQAPEQAADGAEDELDPSLKPIRPEDFGHDQARHLLWRAGFGGTPEQVAALASWGPEKAVDHLLDVDEIEAPAVEADLFDRNIMRPPTAEEARELAEARRRQDEDLLARVQAMRQEAERADRRQVRDVQRWWLTRMIESPRPAEEKLTLFWHGHFATSYRTIENSYHMFMQNQLFRKHSLGSFASLLGAIIRDPAMLAYLDNNDSRRGQPNENLARELMELFGLGVGQYSEQDIKDGARALTGYTFRDDDFFFDQRNHDTGQKRILGASGALDGDGFVAAILRRRACADFITLKLYRYFAADVPADPSRADPATRSVLRGLAGTLRSADYRVKPMLRRLFLSEHFYSPAIVGQHIKSPAELVVGAVRSLLTPVRDLAVLLDAMDRMGQSLFYPPSVKGWDGGRTWVNTSTLFVRQNALSYLLTGRTPKGPSGGRDRFDPTPLADSLSPGDKSPESVAAAFLRFALGREPAGALDAVSGFARNHGGASSPDVLVGMLLLITAMPEYQLC